MSRHLRGGASGTRFMYEVFEHTADLGLRIEAHDLPALFEEAARGLTSLMIENVQSIVARREVRISVEGDNQDYLFFDWLHELLFRFETEQLLLAEFNVTLREGGLDAVAWGENVDRTRHHLVHEVKAITYHSLRIEPIATGLRAEVIVDI